MSDQGYRREVGHFQYPNCTQGQDVRSVTLPYSDTQDSNNICFCCEVGGGGGHLGEAKQSCMLTSKRPC